VQQSSREEFELVQMLNKVGDADADLSTTTQEYAELLISAESQNSTSVAKLPIIRSKMLNLQLKSVELMSQMELLKAQCESNNRKRKSHCKLIY
jgi:hypothetical protein